MSFCCLFVSSFSSFERHAMCPTKDHWSCCVPVEQEEHFLMKTNQERHGCQKHIPSLQQDKSPLSSDASQPRIAPTRQCRMNPLHALPKVSRPPLRHKLVIRERRLVSVPLPVRPQRATRSRLQRSPHAFRRFRIDFLSICLGRGE